MNLFDCVKGHNVLQIVRNNDGYIDVGDGCWRPNELMTSLRC